MSSRRHLLLGVLLASALVAGLIPIGGVAAGGCATDRHRVPGGTWTGTPFPEFPPSPYPPTEDFERLYAVDPHDPSVLLASDTKSVMISTDEGCRWKAVFSLDGTTPSPDAPFTRPSTSVVSLTVDPSGRIYMLLGDQAPYNPYYNLHSRPHLAISDDAGASWRYEAVANAQGVPLQGIPRRMFVSPEDRDTLFLIVSSTEINVQWSGADAGEVTALLGSNDAGKTWDLRSIEPPAPEGTQPEPACAAEGVCTGPELKGSQGFGNLLGLDPRDSNQLWGMCAKGLCHSTDGGRAWETAKELGADFAASAIDVAPSRDGVSITLVGSSTLRSTDGGKTWSRSPGPRPGGEDAHCPDCVITSMAHDARGRVVATLGGPYSGTVLAWSAGHWIEISPAERQGLIEPASAMAITKAMSSGRSFLFSSGANEAFGAPYATVLRFDGWPHSPNGCFRTRNLPGGRWTKLPFPSVDEDNFVDGSYAVDPANSRRLFVSGGEVILRTDDSGCTWKEVFHVDDAVEHPVQTLDQATESAALVSVVTPEDPKTGGLVYALAKSTGPFEFGSRPLILVSKDAGANWSTLDAVDAQGTPMAGDPLALWIAPSDHKTLYLLAEGAPWYDQQAEVLYRSTDGGQTWDLRIVTNDRPPDGEECATAPYCYGPGIYYRHFDRFLTIDPLDPRRLWSLCPEPLAPSPTPADICRSMDGGRVWRPVAPAPVGGIAGWLVKTFHTRKTPPVIVVGAGGEMMISRDDGKSWMTTALPEAPEVEELPQQSFRVDSVVIDGPSDFLLTLEWGFGGAVYRLKNDRWIELTPPEYEKRGNSREQRGYLLLRDVKGSASGQAYFAVRRGYKLMALGRFDLR